VGYRPTEAMGPFGSLVPPPGRARILRGEAVSLERPVRLTPIMAGGAPAMMGTTNARLHLVTCTDDRPIAEQALPAQR